MRSTIDLKQRELEAIKNLLDGKPSGLTDEQMKELKEYLSHKN